MGDEYIYFAAANHFHLVRKPIHQNQTFPYPGFHMPGSSGESLFSYSPGPPACVPIRHCSQKAQVIYQFWSHPMISREDSAHVHFPQQANCVLLWFAQADSSVNSTHLRECYSCVPNGLRSVWDNAYLCSSSYLRNWLLRIAWIFQSRAFLCQLSDDLASIHWPLWIVSKNILTLNML